MIKENKKLTVLIIITLFIGAIILIKYSDIELNKHGILLNAKTTQWVASSYMGYDLKYEFFYNGKKIVGNNPFNKIRGNRDFENRWFPVMYDPKFGTSQLLIEPQDFKEFGLAYPDSLKWVLDYLK